MSFLVDDSDEDKQAGAANTQSILALTHSPRLWTAKNDADENNAIFDVKRTAYRKSERPKLAW